MGLKFGQKYQISVFLASAAFLVATKVSCRDTGRRCRDILLLVATLVIDVATYCCLS